MPSSNQEYWKQKFKRNVERDKREQAELKKRGWKIILIWEYQVKNPGDIIVKSLALN